LVYYGGGEEIHTKYHANPFLLAFLSCPNFLVNLGRGAGKMASLLWTVAAGLM
jgi:hypothetical protein